MRFQYISRAAIMPAEVPYQQLFVNSVFTQWPLKVHGDTEFLPKRYIHSPSTLGQGETTLLGRRNAKTELVMLNLWMLCF